MNFVENIVAGFVAACRAPGIAGQVLHLGSGRGVSMRDLLEIAMKAAGKRPRLESDPRRVPPASEVRELICDSSAARPPVGWQPRVGLEEGVERTARWVADNLALSRPPFAPF